MSMVLIISLPYKGILWAHMGLMWCIGLIGHWVLATPFQLHWWTVRHVMKVHGNSKEEGKAGGKYQPSESW